MRKIVLSGLLLCVIIVVATCSLAVIYIMDMEQRLNNLQNRPVFPYVKGEWHTVAMYEYGEVNHTETFQTTSNYFRIMWLYKLNDNSSGFFGFILSQEDGSLATNVLNTAQAISDIDYFFGGTGDYTLDIKGKNVKDWLIGIQEFVATS